jgi:hypothetical protein
MLPNMYFQVPMCVIGKIYANSMLVLINSRMVLYSEGMSLTIISAARFAMSPANDTGGFIAAHRGDITVYSEERMGPSGRSETEAV